MDTSLCFYLFGDLLNNLNFLKYHGQHGDLAGKHYL